MPCAMHTIVMFDCLNTFLCDEIRGEKNIIKTMRYRYANRVIDGDSNTLLRIARTNNKGIIIAMLLSY